jgi:aspartate/methionine/tyrosine aminotransferase
MTQKTSPQFAVPDEHLIPVADFPYFMQNIPTSRMFIVKQALKTYRDNVGPDAVIYDASQGDGGKSLTGVPREILDQAHQMQLENGTGYGGPAGEEVFRRAVAEDYWRMDAATGWGPGNVVAGMGGRDILMKAYDAMIHKGRGRVGDVLITSAVPWISYNWGPYAAYLNVLRASGYPDEAWVFTEEALEEAVEFALQSGRRPAGVLITSPDNPTGREIPLERQISLARKALELNVAFVLFDWIYHYLTEGEPYDVNQVLLAFEPEYRKRLMFLDGLTKSLGASNIRSAHLLADQEICQHIASRSSHGVIPSFYSQAVAVVAYRMGYAKAAADTIEPTNASRKVIRQRIQEKGMQAVTGAGYYAFINVEEWVEGKGFVDSAELGFALAEQYGIATVPGVFFSPVAKNWVRFSYALPPEKTAAAFDRFYEGLHGVETTAKG